MKMAAATKTLISLLLVVHFTGAQEPSDDTIYTSLVTLIRLSPQSLLSLLLLGVSVLLSGSIYLWLLRYVCVGCCQPIAVGSESQALPGVV